MQRHAFSLALVVLVSLAASPEVRSDSNHVDLTAGAGISDDARI